MGYSSAKIYSKKSKNILMAFNSSKKVHTAKIEQVKLSGIKAEN